MATVYLADDLKHERKVALQVLKPDLAAVLSVQLSVEPGRFTYGRYRRTADRAVRL